MAIRSSTATLTTGGANAPATLGSYAEGDILFFAIAIDSPGVTTLAVSGWTSLGRTTIAGPDAQVMEVFWKVAGASEDTSIDWSVTGTANNVAIMVTAVSGRDSADPFSFSPEATITSNTSSNATPVSAGLAGGTADAGADILIFVATDQTVDADRWDASASGYTVTDGEQDWSSMKVLSLENFGGGATGTITVTLTRTTGSGNTGWIGYVIAVNPGTPPPPPTPQGSFSPYAVPIGEDASITILGERFYARFSALANVAETGNQDTGFIYTRTGSGDYTTTFAGGVGTFFRTGDDFDVILVFASGVPNAGLDSNNEANASNNWIFGCYADSLGSNYKFVVGGAFDTAADAAFASAAGDWIRFNRIGSTLRVYASNTEGDSWTLIKTFTGWTTGIVYTKLNFNAASSIGPVFVERAWDGGTTWNVSGAATKVSQTINAADSSTVVIRPSALGAVVISDGVFSFELSVVPTLRKVGGMYLLPEMTMTQQWNVSSADQVARNAVFDLLALNRVRAVNITDLGLFSQTPLGQEWRKPRLVVSNGRLVQTYDMPGKLLVPDGRGGLRQNTVYESPLP